MKKKQKHNNTRLIILTSAISTITFVIPFLIKGKNDSYSDVFALAFTAVGTIVSIMTLIIGLLILDVYGVKTKFKEREFDNVYELRETLRKIRFIISTDNSTFLLTPYKFDHLKKSDSFEVLKEKLVAFELESFSKTFGNMTIWMEDYFIPQSIKSELAFLNVTSMSEAKKDFIKIKISPEEESGWYIPYSKITLEQFLLHLEVLVQKIEHQMSQYKVKQ